MKIQIIGPSGSGKTTLGKYISSQLNVNFIDTDTYFWKDVKNKVPNSISDREAIFLEDLNKDTNNWVVSGSIFSWNKVHLMDRDIIIYLSVEEEMRIERLITRTNKTKNPSELDPNFLTWAKTYFSETDVKKGGTYICHMAELKVIEEKTDAKIIYLSGEETVEINFKKMNQI
ncbi:shikimate kinase [Spiroplasma endosymbiont of Othius punctulatus]|uniref:shikimate kinase n=1 Tax=Spiroplasma endosymbiont of Othius punctulatus TaxID=3066289 RepID=UPI0030D3E2DE